MRNSVRRSLLGATSIPNLSSGTGNIIATLKAIFYNRTFVFSTAGIPGDATFGLILDKTSFYAEAGGQEYDTGNIVIDGVADFEVTNVQVYNGYVLHTGRLKYGTLEAGNEVISSYDEVSYVTFKSILLSSE
jgi:alanyl-tRNA synthetase